MANRHGLQDFTRRQIVENSSRLNRRLFVVGTSRFREMWYPLCGNSQKQGFAVLVKVTIVQQNCLMIVISDYHRSTRTPQLSRNIINATLTSISRNSCPEI
ncbi:hypothetical protein TNCV_4900471 [Trichonephila clavipes]|nr:hypothetical protein TNCV_4900471 [Trichonephila clavipes]